MSDAQHSKKTTLKLIAAENGKYKIDLSDWSLDSFDETVNTIIEQIRATPISELDNLVTNFGAVGKMIESALTKAAIEVLTYILEDSHLDVEFVAEKAAYYGRASVDRDLVPGIDPMQLVVNLPLMGCGDTIPLGVDLRSVVDNLLILNQDLSETEDEPEKFAAHTLAVAAIRDHLRDLADQIDQHLQKSKT
jgi:hypothetical protein